MLYKAACFYTLCWTELITKIWVMVNTPEFKKQNPARHYLFSFDGTNISVLSIFTECLPMLVLKQSPFLSA
jgi:hypothetical protein